MLSFFLGGQEIRVATYRQMSDIRGTTVIPSEGISCNAEHSTTQIANSMPDTMQV